MTMRLSNFLHDGYFNSLRVQMGARLSSYSGGELAYAPIDLSDLERELGTRGRDVTSDEIRVLEDGTLAYRQFRVLVYIRDVRQIGERQSLPRFHFANCRTLDQMRSANRFQRYVVANREDGNFVVNIIGDEGTSSELISLSVCQNCLNFISWNGFELNRDRQWRLNEVSGFRLKDFFENYPRSLLREGLPGHTADTAPIDDYPSNWGDIAEQVKRSAKYSCSECGLRLSLSESRFLNVHHVNGVKSDSTSENLRVLCIRCHARQLMHAHLMESADYAEFVLKHPGEDCAQ